MLNDVKVTELSNGIRVATSSVPTVESVTFGIWVGVGARYEPKRIAGISHFIEHLLFKGTKNRSARDISEAIEGRGGYLNAFTQEESTCYYARVGFDWLEGSLDVLADMYKNSKLAQSDIDRERGVIIEEIMMYKDQPQHVVHEMLGSALWAGHPLGIPIIGYPKTLKNMNRSDIVKFKQSRYVPGNTIFSFAGRVDHDRCVDMVSRLGGRGKKMPVLSCRPFTSRKSPRTVILANKSIEQTQLALGFRTFGKRDRRRYALRVLSAVLGENMSSRLFQVVREKHGLAYSVHSGCYLYEDTGACIITAGLDRKQHAKALRLIVKELARLKNRPVGKSEMKRAKDYLIGQTRLGLESMTSQMLWLGENVLTHGKFVSPSDVVESINKVTSEDVMKLANTLFTVRNACLSAVSPELSEENEPQVCEILQGL